MSITTLPAVGTLRHVGNNETETGALIKAGGEIEGSVVIWHGVDEYGITWCDPKVQSTYFSFTATDDATQGGTPLTSNVASVYLSMSCRECSNAAGDWVFSVSDCNPDGTRTAEYVKERVL